MSDRTIEYATSNQMQLSDHSNIEGPFKLIIILVKYSTGSRVRVFMISYLEASDPVQIIVYHVHSNEIL